VYGPLWRALRGPLPLRILQIVLLALAAVAICFLWLFPLAAEHLPFNDNTVAGDNGSLRSPAATPSISRSTQ
jgi:hypothetical protein